MHAFARLFTSDLIANDCRVYVHLVKNDEKHVFVSYVNDVNNGY